MTVATVDLAMVWGAMAIVMAETIHHWVTKATLILLVMLILVLVLTFLLMID